MSSKDDAARAIATARAVKRAMRGSTTTARSTRGGSRRWCGAGDDVLANWKGAKLKPLGYSVLAGLVVALIPTPAGVTAQAWGLLAVFVGTIVGIITNPLPLGAVAMIGLTVSMTTGLLPFSAAFSAFSSEIPWLIALAFFLARGFIKTVWATASPTKS